MGLYNIMAIGSTGLAAQRVRMEVLSSNLSNVNSTRGPNGKPYQRLVPVFKSVENNPGFENVLEGQKRLYEVEVASIKKDKRDPIEVYEPDHPDADENGYVRYPNINVVEEMVGVMSASRSYEANLTVVTAAKEMAKKALELAR